MAIPTLVPPINEPDVYNSDKALPQRKLTSIILRKMFRKRSAQVGFGIIAILLFCAIFGPWITPHDPFRI